MYNNIWQIKVSKPGANETYYLSMEQDNTSLNKKEINQLLSKFRNSGFNMSLRGCSYDHFLRFKDCAYNRFFNNLDELLYTASCILPFTKDVIEKTEMHHDIRIDSFYVTEDEMFSLEARTRFDHVDYDGYPYTFISTSLPEKIAHGLYLDMARSGKWFYRGNLVYEIDAARRIVTFYRRSTTIAYTTKTTKI